MKDVITEYFNTTGVVKDEWNTKEILQERILTNKRFMIRAEYAGRSYIPQYMTELSYKVMNVGPTKNLKQECIREAMTMKKFFSISFGDEKLEKFAYPDRHSF